MSIAAAMRVLVSVTCNTNRLVIITAIVENHIRSAAMVWTVFVLPFAGKKAWRYSNATVIQTRAKMAG